MNGGSAASYSKEDLKAAGMTQKLLTAGSLTKKREKQPEGRDRVIALSSHVQLDMSQEKLFQQDKHLAYLAALALDMDTGLLDVTSPMIYAAARKRKDPDTPDYALAMSGVDKEGEEYLVAIQKEITELKAKDMWSVVPRTDAKGSNILPSTWAFKEKRYPDGQARKFKARFCCRGNHQLEGVDYFETYAPTVRWSTIRLLLQ
jgi:hypothetical protein